MVTVLFASIVEAFSELPILITRFSRVSLLEVGIRIMGTAISPAISNIIIDLMVSRVDAIAKLIVNSEIIDRPAAINGPRPEAKYSPNNCRLSAIVIRLIHVRLCFRWR